MSPRCHRLVALEIRAAGYYRRAQLENDGSAQDMEARLLKCLEDLRRVYCLGRAGILLICYEAGGIEFRLKYYS